MKLSLFLVTALLGSVAAQKDQSNRFEMSLHEAANQLSDTNTFQFFDILSFQEAQALETMKIDFEDLSSRLVFNKNCNKSTFEKILQYGNNNQQTQEIVAPILQKLCINLSNMPDARTDDHPMITVDKERTNDVRCWHIDNGDENTLRVIVNLQGAGTLFAKFNQEQNLEHLGKWSKKNLNMIAKNDIRQLQLGQAVVFKHTKAIHSRPEIKSPRALMVIDFYKQR